MNFIVTWFSWIFDFFIFYAKSKLTVTVLGGKNAKNEYFKEKKSAVVKKVKNKLRFWAEPTERK